jgi:hypothetical protein
MAGEDEPRGLGAVDGVERRLQPRMLQRAGHEIVF